jgi:hypothetical protein
MMSTRCSKHVEAWNKYIKKEWVMLVINQNYTKFLSVEAEAFHVDGQTDMGKLTVTYRNFAKVHKNYWNDVSV